MRGSKDVRGSPANFNVFNSLLLGFTAIIFLLEEIMPKNKVKNSYNSCTGLGPVVVSHEKEN